MFKELPEGKTHSFNDGCGDPVHNGKIVDEGYLTALKNDFSKTDVRFDCNSLKAFALGMVHFSQLKKKNISSEHLWLILDELMDLADLLYTEELKTK